MRDNQNPWKDPRHGIETYEQSDHDKIVRLRLQPQRERREIQRSAREREIETRVSESGSELNWVIGHWVGC